MMTYLILFTTAFAVAINLLINKICKGGAGKKALAWVFLGLPALLVYKILIEGILFSLKIT